MINIYKHREISVDDRVIILTYNKLEQTKRCLKTLLKYTSKGVGITLWDNASTDGTQQYLKDLSCVHNHITLILSDENLGVISARNLAYEMDKGMTGHQKIIFLDNDQFVQEGWYESHTKCMSEGGYDIVGVEAWQLNNRNFYPKKKITSRNDNYNYVGAGSAMIKEEVINKIGLFDEQFSPKYSEDPDFCFRAYDAGFKIGWNYNHKVTHDHRGPLLDNETRKYFAASLKKLQNKWRGYTIPVFHMK